MCTFFFSKISLNPTHLCCRGPTSGHGLSVTQSVSVSVYLLCHFVYFCFRLFQFWFLAFFFVFSYITRVVNVSVSAFESSSVAYYVYYCDPRRSLPLFLFLMDRMSEWMSEWVNECSLRAETTIWMMLFGVPFIGAFKRLAHLTFERERVKKSWRVRGCWSKD